MIRIALIGALLAGSAAAADPARGVLRLGTDPGGATCTGVLVAPDLLLTARHCVGAGPGRWAAGWPRHTVIAEGTGLDMPFGPRPATALHADQALVRLGTSAGRAAPPAAMPRAAMPRAGEAVRILGYPRGATALQDRLCRVEARRGTEFALDCRVSSGWSGAPVLVRRSGRWSLAGLVVAMRRDTGAAVATALPEHLREGSRDAPHGPYRSRP